MVLFFRCGDSIVEANLRSTYRFERQLVVQVMNRRGCVGCVGARRRQHQKKKLRGAAAGPAEAALRYKRYCSADVFGVRARCALVMTVPF